MRLPDRAGAIVVALYERNPHLSQGDDESRRSLTRMIAEQVCFELGPSWGHKRADPGRPPSKDAIAQKQPDGRLFAWDLFDGTTRRPHPSPEHIDITGQVFIEVPPVNHLGVTPAGQQVPEQSPGQQGSPETALPTPDRTAAVLEQLQAIAGDLRRMEATLVSLQQEVREARAAADAALRRHDRVTFPKYRGSVTLPALGTHTLTLVPDPEQ